MSSNRKKNHVIYSNNELLLQKLEKFKIENSKLYKRILEGLVLLGNFSEKIEVELYESKNTKEEEYLKLWCSDLDENILIFFIEVSSKKDEMIIEKITNESHKFYDLSIAKKFKLTSENIDMLQTSKIFNFKFGRLITDENSFYSVFLGDNTCYQIQINGNQENIEAKELLSLLNKSENIPTFKNFIDIFSQIIYEKQISYNTILLSAYKNFESIGTLSINNTDQKARTLKKRT